MYHSITIGDKNTWDDWHLIPTTRPLFNPPTVKTNIIDIPGGDGVLDLTTALAGRPTYNNRTGSWTFIVQNGFKDWTALYSEIMVYLHVYIPSREGHMHGEIRPESRSFKATVTVQVGHTV